jgi:hypothetical protein
VALTEDESTVEQFERPDDAGTWPGSGQDFPVGTVGVPCSDLARYHLFTNSLMQLRVPDGTHFSFHHSASIIQNLNQIVGAMEPESEWLWVMGDDHVFAADTLMRLLAWDVDIVAPLCARRAAPFNLVAFTEQMGLDEFGRPMYRTLEYDDLPEERGLMPIHAAGSAGMLVKRRVLDALGEPWFTNSDGFTTNEDVEFCRRAREAGFEIHLDTTLAIGHIGVVTIIPARRGERAGFSLNFQGGMGNSEIFVAGGVRPDDSGAPDVRTGKWQG